jgi:hypothetical protein
VTRDELRSALLRREEGLGDAEWNAVAAALARDAGAREVLVEVNLLTTELRRQLRSARVPASRRPARAWLAVAALVVVLVAIVAIARWPRPEQQASRAGSIPWTDVTPGTRPRLPVAAGQRISVPAGGRTVLQRPDGVELALVGPAEATVGAAPSPWSAPVPPGRSEWLAVSNGEVLVEWPRSVPADGPLIVTPHAWVRPSPPASFAVRVGEGGTSVRVRAGAVDVTRHLERDGVRVSASVQALHVGAEPAEAPDDELARLRHAPASLLLVLLEDARASVGLSRSPCSSRGELEALVVAAALDRTDLVGGALTRVDETLARQRPDGGLADEPYCQAYYLASLAHGLLLLRASPNGAALAEATIERLRPRLEAWSTWLADPAQQRALARGSAGMTSRLASFAAAFGLAGELLGGRADLATLSRRYLDETLALQRPDGAFLVDGRHDSGYQGNTLAKLWWVALRLHPSGLEEPLRRAGEWLLRRIDGRGELDVTGNARTGRCSEDPDGRCRVPNRSELAWGLLYHAARFDSAAFATAVRAHEALTP